MSFSIKQHDSLPNLRATLKNADGTPIDLTDATAIFLVTRVKGGDGSVVMRNECDVIGDPLTGIVEYDFTVDDTFDAGQFEAEFEINFGLEVLTVPTVNYFDFTIVDDIG